MKKETRGRKSVLNAALTKRICKLLAQGSAIKSACIICDVGERTYHNWAQRGQNGEQPFASFFSAVTRAREQHKANLIAIVLAAADKDARHAEWLLERQFPKEFGRTEPRVIVVERSEVSPIPPPGVETTDEWRHDANVPRELVQYLDLLSSSNGREAK